MKYYRIISLLSILVVLTLSVGCSKPVSTQKRRANEELAPSNTAQSPSNAVKQPTPSTLPVSSLKQYPKVILGKDNWLFYGEPMNRLLQEGPLTDAQMKRVIDELVYINNSLKERGIRFLFVLAPDKQLIYPEFLPEKYQDGGPLSTYERMSQALTATDIDFIDTMPILLQKKTETGTRLYYVRDNRWNPYGNFLITQEIMSRLAKNFPVPQYKLISVDTSPNRVVTDSVGNDLNDMMESLSPWQERGASEAVYEVSKPEQAPRILWYGDCFSAPLTEFVQKDWPDTIRYVSLHESLGFPFSFRTDIEKRLNGERIVVLELDEHYRRELLRAVAPELPKIDPSWTLVYDWRPADFLSKWAPVGEFNIKAADDKVLVTTETSSPASFYSTQRLFFTNSRKYYLVIKLTSSVDTGVVVDFSTTTKGDLSSLDSRRAQYSYKGDNTLILEFPGLDYLSSIRSLRIYLGNEAGTYGISGVSVYAQPR